MNKGSIKLTILFEDPFWIGVFEIVSSNKLNVCKVTFGAEPRDSEVYEFVLKNFKRLTFSPEIKIENKKKSINPKRKQREAKKQVQHSGIGTKAQQALSLQREKQKVIHKAISKEQKEEEQERLYQLKKQKRKEKHKGR
ncbi:MAG: YjdF family protein [Thomasclavelia sp.]|nr:YjdF family protein [Thomasclavelia sp.]